MKREILIIGGGVNGVTTGIVLQLLGHSTRIVCKHWLNDSDGAARPYADEPRFASQYPAALIAPHNVAIADESWHLQTSLRFFATLQFGGAAGVRQQRHYEVSESPDPLAPYAPEMPGYHPLPSDGSGEPGAPRRHKDVPIFGWSFLAPFAEMPRYRAFLGGLYRALGGEVKIGQFVDGSTVAREKADVVINCGGAWGASLFGDTTPSRFVKGALLRVGVAGCIPWNRATGEVFSYNYHPPPHVYARPNGATADLYFFPRADCWLFGGTRLESVDLMPTPTTDPDAPWPWSGEMWSGPVVEVDVEGRPGSKLKVPEPMWTVNRDILRELTGHDVSKFPLTATEGYRHRRQTVRLERHEHDGRPIIHNYGHGGSGVTFSWSSAIRAAALAGLIDESHTHDLERQLASSASGFGNAH